MSKKYFNYIDGSF